MIAVALPRETPRRWGRLWLGAALVIVGIVALGAIGLFAIHDDLVRFDAQLRRWQAGPLTASQRRDVTRLAGQLAQLRTAVEAILSLAAELAEGTIERVLAMREVGVGLR